MTKQTKNNLKFKTGKLDITEEGIEKHKNFKKLMHEYHTATTPLYKTPLYKNKKVFLVVLLILLLTYLIVETTRTEKAKQDTSTDEIHLN